MFHIPIFKVVYSTTFTIFLVATLALLLVTPADAIFQSYVNNQLFNVVIIGAAYLLTALVAAFFYATRIYTTRTHLAALPRSARVPDDVAGTAIRRIVAAGQARAATIAYAAHPRDLIAERDEHGNLPPVPSVLYKPTEVGSRDLPKPTPAFGPIAHPGWTSPSTTDLPGVQFVPVIRELPHLLEAKAVSLAPADPLAIVILPGSNGTEDANPPPPDSFAVSVLQRPASMDARSYIAHLSVIGAINDSDLAAEFVTRYEQARFGGQALTESQFRNLMNCFAALLRSLSPPDPELLHDLARSSSTSSIALSSTSRSRPASLHSMPSTSSLRPWATTSTTQPAPARPPMSASAAGLLQRIVTGGDVELTMTSHPGADSDSPPLRGDTPTPHATPFFTPYRSYVSSNDQSTTGSGGSGDSYDADRDSGDSSGEVSDADVEDGNPPPRHRQRRRQRYSSHQSSRPRPPMRSHSSAMRQVGLGLQRLERENSRRSSQEAEEAGWVSFDSEGLGRAAATEEEEEDDRSEAGSVIRRYVTADHPRAATTLAVPDREREDSNSATASEAGSVVVRHEDRGIGGLLPIPVVATDRTDGDGRHGGDRELEMRMVDERA